MLSTAKTALTATLLSLLIAGCAQTPEQRVAGAKKAISGGDYTWAAYLLRPLRGTGNDEADFLAGTAYMNIMREGMAFRTDDIIELYLPLAKKGDARTYYPLGLSYATKVFPEREETSENIDGAITWLGKAADHGSARAKLRLAGGYIEGWVSTIELADAYRLLDEVSTEREYREMAGLVREWIDVQLAFREELSEAQVPKDGCVMRFASPIHRDSYEQKCDASVAEDERSRGRQVLSEYMRTNRTRPFYWMTARYRPGDVGYLLSGRILYRTNADYIFTFRDRQEFALRVVGDKSLLITSGSEQ